MKKKLPASELTSQIHTHLPFEPNHDQVQAIALLSEFILSDDPRSIFILKGYAGTGKTSLISALTRALGSVNMKSVLLAPTGRAAKVMTTYSGRDAFTIHRKIYDVGENEEGNYGFYLTENGHRHTLFIVDEASMIGGMSEGGSRRSLLEDLFEFVFSGEECKLLLCGDTAQLPPVGSELSPALDPQTLQRMFHLKIQSAELKEVARQVSGSAVLYNATRLRIALMQPKFEFPKLICEGDLVNLKGEDLEDVLNRSIDEFGEEEVLIITRSNKRAVMFNKGYRNMIKLMEDDLNAGDRLMVVKNNYFWKEKELGEKNGFIANGDNLEVLKILKREELYGMHFTECMVRTGDMKESEMRVRLITDSLYSDHPALSAEQQKSFQAEVLRDLDEDEPVFKKIQYLKSSEYYNALQVKFSYAVTCHKSQGGQWSAVFIDQGYLNMDELDRQFLRWLYTALTRSKKRLYLLNFNDMLIS